MPLLMSQSALKGFHFGIRTCDLSYLGDPVLTQLICMTLRRRNSYLHDPVPMQLASA
jgi:hypothetical protein